MMFNPDYSDLLKLFTENSVNYVVVGAYAMAAHGYVRATGGIDVFVKPTHENAPAVNASLVALGAPLSGITAEDFVVPGNIYQIGVPPNRRPVVPRTNLIWSCSARVIHPTGDSRLKAGKGL